MAIIEALGSLGGLSGVVLVFGAILLTLHPAGIVALASGILLLTWAAARGVAAWPLWRSERPRWLRVLAALLIGLPLALFALLTLVAVGWMAVTGQWPTRGRP